MNCCEWDMVSMEIMIMGICEYWCIWMGYDCSTCLCAYWLLGLELETMEMGIDNGNCVIGNVIMNNCVMNNALILSVFKLGFG